MSTPTGNKTIHSVHEMPLEELSPEFLKSLKYLKKKLFDEPRVKKLIYEGQEQRLTGDDLANYVSQILL
jgi:hypothetical protein